MLRPGNAGSNTAADHIDGDAGWRWPSCRSQMRRQVLIRADSGGGTHEFLTWLAQPGRRLAYSVGFTITDDIAGRHPQDPRPGVDAGLRRRRRGPRRRVGRRAHRPAGPVRPGRRACGSSSARNARTPARSCGSPTSTGTGSPASPPTPARGQLADLELRHRRRARCEDRIRCAKDTGLRNLPLHGYDQNQIWCEIVALACELLAWMQMLALTGPARRVGTQDGCGCACSPPPGGSSAAAAACGCAWPPAGPGPPRSPPPSAACRPSHPADQPAPIPATRKDNRGPVEPRPPGATAGPPATTSTLKTAASHDSRPSTQDHERSRLEWGMGPRPERPDLSMTCRP